MKILQGLMDNQVLQRNSRNICNVRFSGSTKIISGIIKVSVYDKKNQLVKPFDSKTVCKVKNNEFSGTISGLPVGGPYKINISLVNADKAVKKTVAIKNVLIGDVWILSGQSNMAGGGDLKNSAKPHSKVRAFYANQHWKIARDPIQGGGAGPGIPFGKKMYEYTGVPQGLIPCAKGGSQLDQWKPVPLNKEKFYTEMLNRAKKCGNSFAGMLWYQGCADGYERKSGSYTRKMKNIISSIRKDLNSPKLLFAMAQIASYHCTKLIDEIDLDGIEFAKHWNSVQEQQRLMPQILENLITVPMIDMSLDDLIHISGKSQQIVGRRLADAAIALKKKKANPTINITNIKISKDKLTGNTDIIVSYAGVKGQLQSLGRANGFSLVTNKLEHCDAIYRTDLKGNKIIIKTAINYSKQFKLSLHYGFGTSPYCNITDAEDNSLPVFGPYKL